MAEDHLMDGWRLTPCDYLRDARVWLKRDDTLVVAGISGGKVRTCLQLASRTAADALVTAGSRHSPQVSIVARVGQLLGRGVRCHVPHGQPGPELLDAQAHGAQLVAHRPGYNTQIIKAARDDAAQSGAALIPFGMECPEAVELTALQVANLPDDVARVVVPVGSGMTLAGVLAGRARLGCDWPVLGVWVGADPTGRLDRWAPGWRYDPSVELVQAPGSYGTPAGYGLTGGPRLDPYYEAKTVPYLRPGDLLWVVGRRAT